MQIDSAEARLSRSDVFLALAAGLFLTLVRGLHFLELNQVLYFVLGRRLADPGFIPHDWYTWQATHYHFAFGYLFWLLQQIGPLAITTHVVQWLTMTAFAFGALLLAKTFCRHPKVVCLAVILWQAAAPLSDLGLGGLYLISYYLQPSQIAGSLLVLGMGLLFRRRFLAAGMALGTAGLFHGGIMIAIAPVVLAQVLVCRPWRKPKHLLQLALTLGLFWGFAAVMIAARIFQSDASDLDALRLLIYFRVPYHHAVAGWRPMQSLAWTLWILLGAAAMSRLPREPRSREWRLSFLVALATTAFGLALAVPIMVPTVTMALLWRVASWATFLSLLAVMDRWVDLLGKPGRWSRWDVIFAAGLAAVSLTWIVRAAPPGDRPGRVFWLAALIGSFLAARLAGRLRRPLLSSSRSVLTLLLVLATVMAAFGVVQHSTLGRRGDDRAELEQWLREQTPKDALLVVPPDMATLRLRVERALVVEWKCHPMLPSEVREWLRRLCDVCGVAEASIWSVVRRARPPVPSGLARMRVGYVRLDSTRAGMLRQRYGAQYLVVRPAEHVGELNGLHERFRNGAYAVFEIPPGGTSVPDDSLEARERR